VKEWETEATRELSAILYELTYSQYESKVTLANRLRAVAESIEHLAAPDISYTYTGRVRRHRRHDQLQHQRRREMHLLQPLGEDDPPG
jgi:pterin-4a-carbinolamine dehydratase